MPPALTGRLVVILTVTDADRSAAWYKKLLGIEESSRYGSSNGRLQVVIEEPTTKLQLCLVSQEGRQADRFDEQRIGLDHLEFVVATRGDLDGWAKHLDELDVGRVSRSIMSQVIERGSRDR